MTIRGIAVAPSNFGSALPSFTGTMASADSSPFVVTTVGRSVAVALL